MSVKEGRCYEEDGRKTANRLKDERRRRRREEHGRKQSSECLEDGRKRSCFVQDGRRRGNHLKARTEGGGKEEMYLQKRALGIRRLFLGLMVEWKWCCSFLVKDVGEDCGRRCRGGRLAWWKKGRPCSKTDLLSRVHLTVLISEGEARTKRDAKLLRVEQ